MDIDSDVPLFPRGAARTHSVPLFARNVASPDSDADDEAEPVPRNTAPTHIPAAIRALSTAGFGTHPRVDATWERRLISRVLGGGPLNQWPAPDKSKVWPHPIAAEYYICVSPDLQRWLPAATGLPGALAVFRNKAAHGQVYPLFVRVDTNQWRYTGNYKALDLPGVYLSRAQWDAHFSAADKLAWCSHILEMAWGRDILCAKGIITDKQAWNKDLAKTFTPASLVPFFERDDRDPKRLRMQVRLLQPHRFDWKLYKELILARNRALDAAAADADDAYSAPKQADAAPRRRVRTRRSAVESDAGDSVSPAAPPKRARKGAPTTWKELMALPVDAATLLPYQPAPGAKRSGSDDERTAYAHELVRRWAPLAAPAPALRVTRAFLSGALGGSAQRANCEIGAAKAFASNHRRPGYRALDPAWDPFLPARAGAHGLSYQIRPDRHKPDDWPDLTARLFTIFCKRAPGQWEYCGEYALAARMLVPGEWQQLPETTKRCWSEGLSGRPGAPKWGRMHMEARGLMRPGECLEPEFVLALMDAGKIKLRAMTFECKGYDWNLHNWLATRWEARAAKEGAAVRAEDDDVVMMSE